MVYVCVVACQPFGHAKTEPFPKLPVPQALSRVLEGQNTSPLCLTAPKISQLIPFGHHTHHREPRRMPFTLLHPWLTVCLPLPCVPIFL